MARLQEPVPYGHDPIDVHIHVLRFRRDGEARWHRLKYTSK